MRSPDPWYRKQKDTWCVYLNGSLVTLAHGKGNKKAAERKFHELMLHGGRVADGRLTLPQVCDLFLEYSNHEHEPPTYDQYRHFLQSFCTATGRVKARDLKLHH